MNNATGDDSLLMMYDVKVANPSRGCPMMF